VPRSRNLFAQVVEGENSLTELFCNFLQYHVFRNAFLSSIGIRQDALERISYSDIDTHVRTKAGVPDITIKLENEIQILVEVKAFDAALTDYQPEGYLNTLQSCGAAETHLAFIVPPHYAQTPATQPLTSISAIALRTWPRPCSAKGRGSRSRRCGRMELKKGSSRKVTVTPIIVSKDGVQKRTVHPPRNVDWP
jgi:hypothetical protein